MLLLEFDDQQVESDAILVAANRLEELHKQKKTKQLQLDKLDNLVKFLNNYLSTNSSTYLTLSPGDVRRMVGSQENPFKKSIKNIQGDQVIFTGEEEKAPPESPSPEQSKDVVGKMAKSAMK